MTAAARRAHTETGIEVITFGCRLNAYESEAIRGLAREGGMEDAVIVNTCAVTAEAERQARQAIRGARRRRPGSRIVVTGCAAQIDPDKFAAMDEVDLVVGNIEKLDAAFYGRNIARPYDFAQENGAKILVNDIMSVRETATHLVPGFEGRARAFVQIQQGCDHRCTFCIIPFGRGPSRSVPLGEIVAQARMLATNGYREIVLTGVDISSFGADLPGRPGLGQMVRRLLAMVPEIARLRLSSIDPAEVDEELLGLFAAEERLMPHLHLSLQAGDDMILKRMKRRHSREQAIGLCARLRELRPDIVFGADLIAGFPTETEAMFENTRAVVEDCGLVWLHVFPFSPRPGTPAARMPQTASRTVKARAARLREEGMRARNRYLASQVGTRAQVLVEREGFGRSEHFAPVRFAGAATPGAILPVAITGVIDDELAGEISP
ncbi:MAG TPA: tRNA (N(6)-L-threonylcarbamoyladenosine(37)-C(2))-methylthiotransferase MtaB [Alphaproteobacteria bacterium]|nr:tRNA (N(6)-L-threonylcarbamoyladenosine(37)-C(2))-methylthiotransferase MtaB [Alphaproteobacteria bacterium]